MLLGSALRNSVPFFLVFGVGCTADDSPAESMSSAETQATGATSDSATSTSMGATSTNDGTGAGVECAIGCPEVEVCEGGDCQSMCDCPVTNAVCWADPTSGYPNFTRNCEGATDCAVVTNYLGCCGPVAILGIRAEHVELFEAAEADCFAGTAPCDCGEPVVYQVEDGSEYGEGDPPAIPACVENRCESVAGA